jgi:hypothetical protein
MKVREKIARAKYRGEEEAGELGIPSRNWKQSFPALLTKEGEDNA